MQVVYTNYSGQMMDNYLLLVPGLVGFVCVCNQFGGYNMFICTAKFWKLHKFYRAIYNVQDWK